MRLALYQQTQLKNSFLLSLAITYQIFNSGTKVACTQIRSNNVQTALEQTLEIRNYLLCFVIVFACGKLFTRIILFYLWIYFFFNWDSPHARLKSHYD